MFRGRFVRSAVRYASNWSPLAERAELFDGRTAIVDEDGTAWQYGQLLEAASTVAGAAAAASRSPMALVLTEPSAAYVKATYGAWEAGLCTVPLCTTHTVPEMQYYGTDSEATVLLHDAPNAARAAQLAELLPGVVLVNVSKVDGPTVSSGLQQNSAPDDRPAVLIYTSGTTGRPKGAVHTHASISNQVQILVDSWGWTEDDRMLNCLPLHHVHGMVNALFCALHSGAMCRFLPATAGRVYNSLGKGEATIFTAVPTIYSKLLQHHWSAVTPEARAQWKAVVSEDVRLMISGSMALPAPTLEKWYEASGHWLLERYGMTETGMVLSEGLHGERIPGAVGYPLPTVSVSVVSDTKELLVKTPSLFKEYWNRPDATRESFTPDGWFRTGDCVSVSDNGVYTIEGRLSVDIIKSAGYKLSALEIESVLLQSPEVREAAVVGLQDDVYGQVVAAVITASSGSDAEEQLRSFCAEHLAKYKVPRRYLFVDQIPRNAMGKVNKKELVKLFS